MSKHTIIAGIESGAMIVDIYANKSFEYTDTNTLGRVT